jgi:phosphate transport system substrate-binding protein
MASFVVQGHADRILQVTTSKKRPNPAVGYPIVSFTWGLFYQRGNGAKQQALQKTVAYILSDAAQAQAPGLGYISLPQPVLKQARQALSTIQP